MAELSIPAGLDAELAALAALAADLRRLPRGEFRVRLKKELEEKAAMSTTTVKPIREGFRTLTPYLIVHEAEKLLEFVQQAFGAELLLRATGSAGGMHAEVRIGDSILMLGGGGQWRGTPTPTSLWMYVQDADAVYQRALRAGATTISEPTDQPYGDREAGVKDVAGNEWYISTHLGPSYVPEGLNTVNLYLHPAGVRGLIEFLKRAFGAEEVERHQGPDGAVVHAKIRIGSSVMGMGEAHGPYQNMPSTIYMYVPDVDATYRRALEAGAESVLAPADQPYGDRNAGVRDLVGNTWYIATHVRDVEM
jgi:uncharacterized glyoxalase superfamily protein PhnB